MHSSGRRGTCSGTELHPGCGNRRFIHARNVCYRCHRLHAAAGWQEPAPVAKGKVEKLSPEERSFRRYKRSIEKKFGVPFQVVQNLFDSQNGECAICPKQLPPLGSGLGKQSAGTVDHCHKTGKIRGILCDLCNKGLGLFKDNPEILQTAAVYVKVHSDLGG